MCAEFACIPFVQGAHAMTCTSARVSQIYRTCTYSSTSQLGLSSDHHRLCMCHRYSRIRPSRSRRLEELGDGVSRFNSTFFEAHFVSSSCCRMFRQ